jgi:hypothetical protein
MTRVLFVAHGMGDHPPGWESKVVAKLDSLLSSYPKFNGESHPFSTRVVIEPISYDAIFDKYVLQWGRQRGALAEFAQSNGMELNGVLGLLGSGQLPADVTSELWETFLDPVLYRGSLVGERVLQSVTDQLRTRWTHHLHMATQSGDTVEVSVLAHSLGTIVMSEALAWVGENRDNKFPLLASNVQRIELFMTLANVSQLGPTKLHRINSLDTVVRPTTAPPASHGLDNYIGYFINARHKFDPFCFWQRFDPTGWGTKYELIDELDHFHDALPHGFAHYLAHPLVHIPLFRKLLGNGTITKPHELAALKAFNPLPAAGACSSALGELKAEYALLRNLPSNDNASLDDFVKRALRVLQASRTAHAQCLQLPEGSF